MTTEDQDSEDVDKIDYFEGERFNDDADDAANDDIAAASAAEGTSGAQPPETPAASVSGVVEDTSMSEQPSYRMGPDDIRSSLDAITDSLLEDDDTKQKFRNDKTLFVLLGQAHGFVLESQFDEAHDKLAALQALLAEEL
jgi:hypothetical protein